MRPRSSSVRRAAGCGAARRLAPTLVGAVLAVLAVLAVALAGCAGDSDGGAEGPVTVYVSLPLRGPAGADGRDAADGARLALADAGGEAGGREVRAVYLDDTTGRARTANPDPAQVAENARRAIRDSSAIAYVGELDSGATRSSLPITNEARLLQVSPGSGADDLVREPGTFDDVPAQLQPSGERSFVRVIPSDDAQARAAARWVRLLKGGRVFTVSDGSAYGDAATAAFAEAAEQRGLKPRALPDRASISCPAAAPAFVAAQPATLARSVVNPDEIAANAGSAAQQGSAAKPVLTTDAALDPRPLRALRHCGRVLHITSGALDPSQLPPAGQELARRFRQRFGRPPGRYAAYGYEAMALALDAIAGGGDRAAVVDALFATPQRDSVLGSYEINELGETTLDAFTGYGLRGGKPKPETMLRAAGD